MRTPHTLPTVITLCLIQAITDDGHQRRVASATRPQRLIGIQPGDVIIGALFPVHEAPDAENAQTRTCGLVREQYGIHRVEASFQVLDEINTNQSVLPNVTLGIEIRDSCWYAPTALEQSIEFIRDAISPKGEDTNSTGMSVSEIASLAHCPKSQLKNKNFVGVVGPGSSAVTIQVQNLLQLFNIPQIGYSATSKDLSDKNFYRYFLRVVPSDFFQAQLMVDVLKHFNWTYVQAINSDGNYGQNGMEVFQKVALNSNICIAYQASIPANADGEYYHQVLEEILHHSAAKIVVCFCEGSTVKGLLNATRRYNATGKFIVFGSDGWSDRPDVVKNLEYTAMGSLSIRLHVNYDVEFDKYYFALNPFTNTRNPWFKEFWEQRFNCSLDGHNTRQYNTSCTGNEKLSNNYTQDTKMEFVKKAILTMAHGLNNMYKDFCPKQEGLCQAMLPLNGSIFLQYLLNVSFDYKGERIFFQPNGDSLGQYDIMNYQRLPNGGYDYVQVGDMVNGTMEIKKPIQFHSRWAKESLILPALNAPESICSKPCPKGKVKSFHSDTMRCCWTCIQCKENQIVLNESACLDCEKGYWPNENLTGCDKIPVEYIQWFDTEAIVAMSIAIFGIASTITAMVIFIRHNNTPIVKASTRELSYIIMVGMLLCHGATFALLAKPSQVTCFITRVLPGLSFAMIYAALVTKTNRIARILAGSKKKIITKKPRFMSAASQVVITWLIISVEAGIIATLIVFEPPDYKYDYPTLSRVKLVCNTTTLGVIAPLGFDFFLIAMCTVYAVKTRNVPENFNEAKFIGFTMYTTLVIWAAFVPIYFGSKHKVITLCLCISFSAIVALVLLFVPKVYIIVFRPEKNNRSAFTTAKDVRCHIGYMNSGVSRNSSHSASEFSMGSPRNHSGDVGASKGSASAANAPSKPGSANKNRGLSLFERFRVSKQDRIAASVAQHIRAVRAAEALDRNTRVRHPGTAGEMFSHASSSTGVVGKLPAQRSTSSGEDTTSSRRQEIGCQTTDDLIEMWLPCLRRRIVRSDTQTSTLTSPERDVECDAHSALRRRSGGASMGGLGARFPSEVTAVASTASAPYAVPKNRPPPSYDVLTTADLQELSEFEAEEEDDEEDDLEEEGIEAQILRARLKAQSLARSVSAAGEHGLDPAQGSSIVEESASSGGEDNSSAVYKNIIINLGQPTSPTQPQQPHKQAPTQQQPHQRQLHQHPHHHHHHHRSSGDWAEVSAQGLLRSYNEKAAPAPAQIMYPGGFGWRPGFAGAHSRSLKRDKRQ